MCLISRFKHFKLSQTTNRKLRLFISIILQVYPVEDKLKASLDAATNPRDKVLILRQLKQISHHTHSGFWQISLLTVFGMFNRPTFIAFAIGPIFFWLYRGAPLRKISFYTVQIRLCFLLSVGLPLAAALIICDTIYYKRGTYFELYSHYLQLSDTNAKRDYR